MEIILQTAATAAITAIVSAFITLILNYIINGTKKKRVEKEEKLKENIRIIVREENRIGVINDNLIKEGLQAILKNELKETYNLWITRGFAPQDVKDDTERMYQTYHALGANGVMDAQRDKFLALPNNTLKTTTKKEPPKANITTNKQNYRPFEY